MSGQTSNYGFELIDFDNRPWDVKDNNRWTLLDRVLSLVARVPRLKGVWATATVYAVGDNVLDPDTLNFYNCTFAHTSPSSGTFSSYRVTNPTHWQQIAETAGSVRFDLVQTLDSTAQARARANIGAAAATGNNNVLQGAGPNQNTETISLGGDTGNVSAIRASRANNDLGKVWTDLLAASSMAANGYQKFPSGFILQWGSATVSSGGTISVTFPVAFPNVVLVPVTTINPASYNTTLALTTSVTSVLKTGFSLNTNVINNGGSVGPGAGTIGWMCGGY